MLACFEFAGYLMALQILVSGLQNTKLHYSFRRLV